MAGIKKFLANKNTVTVIGFIAAVLVVWVGYTWQVRRAINPVEVPYARQTISPGTQITQDMVGTRAVPPTMITRGTIRSRAMVVDRFSSADTIIPEGSLFFERNVVERSQLPAAIIFDYPRGHVLFNLAVNMQTTMGNSIFPGNYIDIFFQATMRGTGDRDADLMNVELNTTMYERLFANVRVLAVMDSNGRNVFANQDENLTPAMIIIALPPEDNLLLAKAQTLRTFDSRLIPIPTANSLEEVPGQLTRDSQTAIDFINRVTVWTGG